MPAGPAVEQRELPEVVGRVEERIYLVIREVREVHVQLRGQTPRVPCCPCPVRGPYGVQVGVQGIVGAGAGVTGVGDA